MLGRRGSTRQTVDLVAAKLVGGIVKKHSDLEARMDEWIDDDYMWARRTAIIYQLNYKVTPVLFLVTQSPSDDQKSERLTLLLLFLLPAESDRSGEAL
jgi:hypothetical protein